jgi:hypothetical protein
MKRVLLFAAVAALLAGPATAQQMRGGSFDGSPGMSRGAMGSGSMRPMRQPKKMMMHRRMHSKKMMHHRRMRSM